MKKFAIIVAGGSGVRMKSSVPKQFMLLCSKPVLMHTIEKFHPVVSDIIVVLPAQHVSTWQALCEEYRFNIPHHVAIGGETRFHSVKNGLELIKDNGMVAIHDGVRPLITKEFVELTFNAARKNGNAVPVIPVEESLRKKEGDQSYPVDRSQYFIVQTPQIFEVMKIKKAYQQSYIPQFTDDGSVMESAGERISLSEGLKNNYKITTAEDMAFAEFLLSK